MKKCKKQVNVNQYSMRIIFILNRLAKLKSLAVRGVGKGVDEQDYFILF